MKEIIVQSKVGALHMMYAQRELLNPKVYTATINTIH
jgi:hypothetical protein